jgi:stage V sporulation protein D (sporulation-specific penicillin-binding protein)
MVVSAKNAKSGDMPYSYSKQFEPVDGNSIVLTIDEVIQHSLEKLLERRLSNKRQKQGVGIVMDVNTGRCGYGDKPDFDPNEPNTVIDPDALARIVEAQNSPVLLEMLNSISDPDKTAEELNKAMKNALEGRAVPSVAKQGDKRPYEPGSVFKV